jgi:predicted phage-related endonuclease
VARLVHDIEQRSEAWHKLRLGRLCGSDAAKMLATNKDGKPAASRRNLRVQLALERITGRSGGSDFQTQAMRDGIDREVDATGLYEALTGRVLRSVGFVAHDILMAGCSPDGVVGDWTGIVEVKSPIPATHLDYLTSGQIPTDYLRQIQHNLWITGAEWCDWLSFNPDFPPHLKTKLLRVVRDDVQMKAYELLVRQFLAEVDKEVEAVNALAGVPA